jgi:hypothetical protein
MRNALLVTLFKDDKQKKPTYLVSKDVTTIWTLSRVRLRSQVQKVKLVTFKKNYSAHNWSAMSASRDKLGKIS